MSVPESFYRETIDLNRFSNRVARDIITNYNNVILDLTNQLALIDEVTAPATVARIRAMLATMKDSLETWSGTSSAVMIEQLNSLALFQTDFVASELKKVFPSGNIPVNVVSVSSDFARSVVTTDPTQINILNLPNQLEPAVQGRFSLTALKGSQITLPNGVVVEKAFRGIADSQADLISSQVRIGITEGESMAKIGKRLRGRLQFGANQEMTAKAQRLAGGTGTKLANNQVMAIVRTTVNQVQNAASQAVYKANRDITAKYQYVATLDSRTSLICASLDGKIFDYNAGPLPPQHFNCRSTTVPVLDDAELERMFPDTRPSATGRVPQDMNYGTWLRDNPAIQTKTLGNKKKYFNYLINTKNKSPREALRLIVRDDGSELSLKDLANKYPKAK
jgi:SPP1 gp7 family putative phage head morphogenesis protein